MWFLIAFGGAIALILLFAFLLDLQDKRHGRRSNMRLGGWMRREGQFNVANSLLGYMTDVKGTGSVYSAKALRGDSDEPQPPKD